MEMGPRRTPAPVSRRPRERERDASSFAASAALSRAFGIFGSQFFVLVPLAAVFLALPFWLQVLQRQEQLRLVESFRSAGRTEPVSWLESMGGSIVIAVLMAQWILPLAFQAVVTYAVFQRLRGTPARYGASIARALQRFPVVFLTSVLLVLVLLAGWIPMSAVLGATGAASPVLVVLLVLAWAGYVLSRWFVGAQVAVVEPGGPARALGRSSALTQGARGRIFGIVALLYGVPWVLEQLITRLFFDGVETFAAGGIDYSDLYVESGLQVVFLGLQAVTAACVYHGLREAKEGVGVDELLKVFS